MTRRRDGTVPEHVSLSRTIINRVMRDRVAMLAKDALYVQAHDGSVGKLYRVGYERNAQPAQVRLPLAGAVWIIDSDLTRPGVVVAFHPSGPLGLGAGEPPAEEAEEAALPSGAGVEEAFAVEVIGRGKGRHGEL